MSRENCELFIDAVRRYPCLYNYSDEAYKDLDKKEHAWEAVARICELSDVKAAKLKWKRLRDYYKDCLHRERAYRSTLQTSKKKWSYMGQMEFVRQFVTQMPTHSSSFGTPGTPDEDDIDSYPDNAGTSLPESSRPEKQPHDAGNEADAQTGSKRAFNKCLQTRLRNDRPKPQLCRTNDPCDLFFQSMSEVVKRLPPLSQNKLKTKISNLVFAEELRFLESQTTPTAHPCSVSDSRPAHQDVSYSSALESSQQSASVLLTSLTSVHPLGSHLSSYQPPCESFAATNTYVYDRTQPPLHGSDVSADSHSRRSSPSASPQGRSFSPTTEPSLLPFVKQSPPSPF